MAGKSAAEKEKDNIMKNLNKALLVAAIAAVFGLANQASAQSQLFGDDGIAASPKVRQQLNEQKARSAATMTLTPTGYVIREDSGIAASPKVREALEERRIVKTVVVEPSATARAGYRPTGDDGITASPKLRQQLDQRAAQEPVMIAPLK